MRQVYLCGMHDAVVLCVCAERDPAVQSMIEFMSSIGSMSLQVSMRRFDTEMLVVTAALRPKACECDELAAGGRWTARLLATHCSVNGHYFDSSLTMILCSVSQSTEERAMASSCGFKLHLTQTLRTASLLSKRTASLTPTSTPTFFYAAA